MIIDYDHNPALTTDQKLQSLKESVQMALNELEANNAPEKKNSLAKTIIESYSGSTLAGIAQSVKSAIDAVASRFASYVPTSRKVNNKALSSDISLTASDVSAVPTTRTVNNKALSSNISLTAADVSAVAKSGDTMTGNLVASTSGSTERYVAAQNSTGTVYLDVQADGKQGVWSSKLNKFLTYADASGNAYVNSTAIPASATLVKMSQQGWGTSLSFNCTKFHAIVLMSSQILLIWLGASTDVNTLLVQNGQLPTVKSGTGNVTNGNWKVTRSGTNVTINAVSGSATMTAFYV